MGAGSRPAETGTDIAPEYGNGKASAVLFGREGARVFAVDRVIEAAEETRRIIEDEGGVCMAFAADVARADEVEAATTACMDAWGRIDVLHNNVGITSISGQSDAVAETEERWDRVMDVNVKGMFLTCRAALPHMEAQGSGLDHQHLEHRRHPLDRRRHHRLLGEQGRGHRAEPADRRAVRAPRRALQRHPARAHGHAADLPGPRAIPPRSAAATSGACSRRAPRGCR